MRGWEQGRGGRKANKREKTVQAKTAIQTIQNKRIGIYKNLQKTTKIVTGD